jgi:hypothetical protein
VRSWVDGKQTLVVTEHMQIDRMMYVLELKDDKPAPQPNL